MAQPLSANTSEREKFMFFFEEIFRKDSVSRLQNQTNAAESFAIVGRCPDAVFRKGCANALFYVSLAA